jgi:hypothetical protein
VVFFFFFFFTTKEGIVTYFNEQHIRLHPFATLFRGALTFKINEYIFVYSHIANDLTEANCMEIYLVHVTYSKRIEIHNNNNNNNNNNNDNDNNDINDNNNGER